MEIAVLPFSEIDLDSRTFVFSFPRRDRYLRESLERWGLLEPPVVLADQGKILPVAGEGRLLALRGMGVREVSCRILRGLSPLEAQWLALESNRFRELNLVEKAEALARFSRYLSAEELSRQVLPRLGLKPDPEWYYFLRDLAAAPDELKWAVAEGRLPLKVARILLKCPEDTRQVLLEILERFRFTASEKREVVEGLRDLARRDGLSVEEVLSRHFENLPGREEFLKRLRALLRPHIFELEKTFFRYREALRSRGALLEIPPGFEGETLRLSLPFRSREELLQKLQSLQRLLEDHPDFLTDKPSGKIDKKPSPVAGNPALGPDPKHKER